MDLLMAEIIEDHIQFHILDSEHKPTAEQKKAARENHQRRKTLSQMNDPHDSEHDHTDDGDMI